MADEKPTKTPPYFPKKTLDTAAASFVAAGGVPSKLDKTVLSTMSGSGRSAFLVGLKFLGLVDDDHHSLPPLEKYVTAEGQARQAVLKEILTNSYSFLKNKSLDLTRATSGQLSDAMVKEGATASTREKAVAFFLKAAEDAGIPVSQHILKRKQRATPTPKRKSAKNGNTEKSGGDGTGDGDDAWKAAFAANAAKNLRTPYDVLMHDIYDPAGMPEGSAEEKAVFTLARYLKTKGTGS